ncbi:hypothetical protein SAMN05216386_2363 [Nitrosospira briensis]|uniref:Uncharacterized protein n=2 Tax=Nitrosospira briensis TaxID=35799 RepID=A0A1I5DQQ1_9PROT|nr:hypothetical protein [Nitrosospira briensis]SFO01595.1 hypothetical protein SAMN05216386_2363 [Nitrosospira briensis]SFO36299.1 hypothetical protein SAMN05216332_11212 [Nitrosospira briensis]
MAFPGLINRSLATTVVVCSVPIIWAAGMTCAKADNNMPNQSSSSSQSGSGGNSSQPKPKNPSGVAGHGILHEGMESGQVDQKIRVDRNKGTDPSLPPPVRKNEKGVVTEDPSDIQGGPIGPN